MVRAGAAVDAFIDKVIPYLEKGDIIIDGGNSHFPDTIRRTEYVESKGLLYIGTGVSGGEEGALLGPSIMPGGSKKAWPAVKKIFQTISAHTDEGVPCCDWVGENGAGHFVKMVHNGIEYGDMQMICETYQMMKVGAAHVERPDGDGFRALESRRSRFLSDRNHPRHSWLSGSGRQRHAGFDSRHGRPERDRKMDRHRRLGRRANR